MTSHFCFQGVIRASVTQDHDATQMKAVTPSLEIKLPILTDGSREKQSPPLATMIHSDSMEEDEEDEDDWDNFQSFPASTNPAGNDSKVESVAKDPGLVQNSSDLKNNTGSDDFQECSTSQPHNNVKEINNAENQEAGEEVISDRPGSLVSLQSDAPSGGIGMHEACDFQTNDSIKPCDDQPEEKEEVVQSQERDETVVSSHENEQISSDLQHEVRNENPDNNVDQILVDSLPLEDISNETHGEGNRENEEKTT